MLRTLVLMLYNEETTDKRVLHVKPDSIDYYYDDDGFVIVGISNKEFKVEGTANEITDRIQKFDKHNLDFKRINKNIETLEEVRRIKTKSNARLIDKIKGVF